MPVVPEFGHGVAYFFFTLLTLQYEMLNNKLKILYLYANGVKWKAYLDIHVCSGMLEYYHGYGHCHDR